MSQTWEFAIWQGDEFIAGGRGPDRGALEREAMHYFGKYVRDGAGRMILGLAPLPAPSKK